MSIRVLLADDHGIFREGLRALLDRQIDIEVVAEVDDGRAAVKAASKDLPDVAVMDISMPGMNGVEATRQIKTAASATKVICLSMHAEAPFVTAALEAGASGYLLKEGAFSELVRAIHAVRANQSYLSPAITELVVQGYAARRTGDKAPASGALTRREREILQLIAEGHCTKAIAGRLCVSVKTVGTHREHLMDKLNIHSIAGLTKYAIRTGVTALDEGRPA
jgi:DNA-binding NarL/FixJ family response regulator